MEGETTAKYITVFKRYEQKYLITTEKFEQLFAALSEHMEVDKYGLSLIQNIYYDTPTFRLIRESIDKPMYKEKFRMRCYGQCTDGTNCFAEIKKKFNGVVFKRRVDMTCTDMLAYLIAGEPPVKRNQITDEIDWMFKVYENLKPAMYISYERIALAEKKSGTLRITFDKNITYRKTDLDLRNGSYGDKLLHEGEWLMEVKIPGTSPMWLVKLFEEMDLWPISFSKYGNAYKTLLQNKSITIGGIQSGDSN